MNIVVKQTYNQLIQIKSNVFKFDIIKSSETIVRSIY
jgi:hypothetical protein